MLINLIYASSALSMMEEAELMDILEKAREKNARLGITGMLLYKNGNFLQVLEGEAAQVDRLFERIQQDPRHRSLLLIARREVPQRQFEAWSMGFVNLQKFNAQDVPGFSTYLTEPFTPDDFAQRPTLASSFLEAFRDGMR